MPVRVPATPLPTYLTADVPGEAGEGGPSAWIPTLAWGEQGEVPGFGPAQLWLVLPLLHYTFGCKTFLSVCPSLCLTL